MKTRIASIALILISAASLWADVKPSALFGDHLVLQSGMAVPVRGAAAPGEPVIVTFNTQKPSATASADGKWTVRLRNQRRGQRAGRRPLRLEQLPRGLQPLQSSGPPSRSLPHGSMAV